MVIYQRSQHDVVELNEHLSLPLALKLVRVHSTALLFQGLLHGQRLVPGYFV
jgi:hypothetical protein